jgi:hypothetical protein
MGCNDINLTMYDCFNRLSKRCRFSRPLAAADARLFPANAHIQMFITPLQN